MAQDPFLSPFPSPSPPYAQADKPASAISLDYVNIIKSHQKAYPLKERKGGEERRTRELERKQVLTAAWSESVKTNCFLDSSRPLDADLPGNYRLEMC